MMYTKPRVKICCISSKEEAMMAIKYGASALGLVGRMPSGPGVIGDNEIREIAQSVPPPIATFLLTSEVSASAIISHYQRTQTTAIQMVDQVAYDQYPMIRKALPHVKLIQVVHVTDESSIELANEVTKYIDAILVDSGNPNLETKELGGTGRTHNWNISRQIVRSVPVPVFLAGGLGPHNVQDAIGAVRPFGVDLCTRIRTDGKLDEKKLRLFFEQITIYKES